MEPRLRFELSKSEPFSFQMAEAVRFTSCKPQPVGFAFELRSHLKLSSSFLLKWRCCANHFNKKLAEAVRFELTEELPPRQFSRLLP